jgi:hypothetical protein
MPQFFLENLGRNVIRLTGPGGITIRNTGEEPAQVFVDGKQGSAWRPLSGPVTLDRGQCWSASRGELGHDQLRVVARGRDDGRPIVRVEY